MTFLSEVSQSQENTCTQYSTAQVNIPSTTRKPNRWSSKIEESQTTSMLTAGRAFENVLSYRDYIYVAALTYHVKEHTANVISRGMDQTENPMSL